MLVPRKFCDESASRSRSLILHIECKTRAQHNVMNIMHFKFASMKVWNDVYCWSYLCRHLTIRLNLVALKIIIPLSNDAPVLLYHHQQTNLLATQLYNVLYTDKNTGKCFALAETNLGSIICKPGLSWLSKRILWISLSVSQLLFGIKPLFWQWYHSCFICTDKLQAKSVMSLALLQPAYKVKFQTM